MNEDDVKEKQLIYSVNFADILAKGQDAPVIEREKKNIFDDIQMGDTVTVSMMEHLAGIPYYPLSVRNAVLIEGKQFKDLVEKVERLESDNRKMKKLLQEKGKNTYSLKDKLASHSIILMDAALLGKSNKEIERTRRYSRSAISRVLAISVKPGMTEDELSVARENDLRRLYAIYESRNKMIRYPTFDIVEKWYEQKAKATLEHHR